MRFRTAVAVIALSGLGLVAGACGSSGSTKASATTVAAGGSSTTAANTVGSTATGDTSGGSTAPGSDSTSAGDVASVEVVSEMGTGDVKVTWDKDKAFAPAKATVKVGQVVEFVSADGAPMTGIGLAENGHDSRTLTSGMSVAYKFTKAGTFTLYEQINAKTFVVTVTD